MYMTRILDFALSAFAAAGQVEQAIKRDQWLCYLVTLDVYVPALLTTKSKRQHLITP